MAHSSGTPENQTSGTFTHTLSGTTFSVISTPTGMTQAIARHGITAKYPVAYVIGSGHHAFGYLIRIGDYLFQSPISYYSRRGAWDMAPGYEHDRLPDFTRPVTYDCLLCHAGSSFPVDETMNRYKPPYVGVMGISCSRCHGPVEAHLRKPSRNNIINPARLPAKERDSVCEQCHLAGEARVANPGRKFSDFQPGEKLEDVYSIYVFDNSGHSGAESSIKVVSQAEQLAKSACARMSGGRLWCGTCHDPHNRPVDVKSYYRDRCLSCHGPRLPESHPKTSDDCIGCHMPTRPTNDGGHTAFTDHRITRRPEPGISPAKDALIAWREPENAVQKRNLGLAYITVGERDERPQFLERGLSLLLSTGDVFANDPEVLTGIGVVYLRKGMSREALRVFERVAAMDPNSPQYQTNLATGLAAIGDGDSAIQHLNRAIDLDPSIEMVYRLLAGIYAETHDDAGVRQTLERYLKFSPQSVTVRAALGLR